MDGTAQAPGPLALLAYQAYPSAEAPWFSHMLISSTAPLEAEEPHHRDLDADDFRASALNVEALRRDLERFLAKPGAGSERQRLRVVVRIHGYNVPLRSVRREFAEASKKFRRDANAQAADPPDDYVLFVHYAWPSERFGAGGAWRWFRAMPVGLLLLLALGALLAITASGVMAVLGEVALGIVFTLVLLRAVVYFRDAYRASSFGVFDAVEMIRALHHLVRDIGTGNGYLDRVRRQEAPRISLSFLAHSMGTFLTTALVRVLSNVFDASADAYRWQANPTAGPFAMAEPAAPASEEEREQVRLERAAIGELFILDQLILVAADIPVWSIAPTRPNDLASCLRRFSDTVLFVNDADMVLRLASTLANYVVFPAATRLGGYRLGNLSVRGRGVQKRGYGWRAADLRDLELHGALQSTTLCDREPFRCDPWIGYRLNVVDCTDYTEEGRHLSAITAPGPLRRTLNYAATLLSMLPAVVGGGGIDSHGGYFRGPFCLNLLYQLALRGVPPLPPPAELQDALLQHRISWISIPSDPP